MLFLILPPWGSLAILHPGESLQTCSASPRQNVSGPTSAKAKRLDFKNLRQATTALKMDISSVTTTSYGGPKTATNPILGKRADGRSYLCIVYKPRQPLISSYFYKDTLFPIVLPLDFNRYSWMGSVSACGIYECD